MAVLHCTATIFLLLSVCFVAAQDTSNFTALIESRPELSNLTSYLGFYPEIVQELVSGTYATFLAPNNEAFADILTGPGVATLAANDPSLIEALFQYHVLKGTYHSTDFSGGPKFIPTALTNAKYTNVTGGQVVEVIQSGGTTLFYSGFLSNSTITVPNLAYDSGFVHIVDRFLSIPQNLSSTLDAFDLTAAIGTNVNSSNGQISGSQSLPSQLTVFVPTNEAFAAIGSSCTDLSTEDIARLADYHLIPNLVEYSTSFSNGTLTTETQQTLAITVVDGDFYVNNARIEIPNLLTKEGVVHVIDSVLNPLNTSISPDYAAAKGRPAFSGTSDGSTPFTSGIPIPSASILIPTLLNPAPTAASMTSPEPSSPTSPTSKPSPASTSSSALSTGAKAGIGVGVGLGFLVLIAAIGFLVLRSRKGKRKPESSNIYEIQPAEKDMAAEMNHDTTVGPEMDGHATSGVSQKWLAGTHELEGTTTGPELDGARYTGPELDESGSRTVMGSEERST